VAEGARTRWAWIAGTFFGAGDLKPGPGTWGSVAATLIWLAIFANPFSFDFAVAAGPDSHRTIAFDSIGISLFLAFLATAIGIPAATIIARESGRKDPQNVVIDEVAGQWLTLAAAAPDWKHALVGLGLFRLFDITKPWPARQLEHLPEGWGIMFDDLAAGVYGAIILVVLRHWW
jgi:phosphatidylglycerophosphatase A